MPNIKPISALRNYTEILKQVDTSNRVYLTRNGHGEYGILTMAEIDELDRYRAAYTLMSRLRNGRTKRDGFLQMKRRRNWGYLIEKITILSGCD